MIFLEHYEICGFKELQEKLADPQKPLGQYSAVLSVVPTFGGVKAEIDLKDHGYVMDQHFFHFLDHFDPFLSASPSEDDVRRALQATVAHQQGAILAHCFAGKSRSSAAIYADACRRLGPGSEREILDAMFVARPKAVPNPVYTLHADFQLGREGRMLEGLLTHPMLPEKYRNWVASVSGHKDAAVKRHELEFAQNSQDIAPALYTCDPGRLSGALRASASYTAFREWQRQFTPGLMAP